MSDVRRCLGCSATYPAGEHACPRCGSHAAEVEAEVITPPKEETAAKPKAKPTRRPRKT